MTNELTRPLTGAEERLWQEKLAALLVRQIALYTANESSSVPAAAARELLRGVLFFLAVPEEPEASSRPEDVGSRYEAERAARIRVLLPLDLADELARGQRRAQRDAALTIALWRKVVAALPPLENRSLRDTLRSIGRGFRRYDTRFFPQRFDCDIDYQLSQSVSESLLGINYVNQYLARLAAENSLLTRLPQGEVRAVLERSCPDWRGLLVNLYAPAAANVLARTLLGGEGLTLSDGEIGALRERWEHVRPERIENDLLTAADALAERLALPRGAGKYLSSCAREVAVRAESLRDCGGLLERMAQTVSLDERIRPIVQCCEVTELILLASHVITRRNAAPPPSATSLLIAKAVDYLQTHYTDPGLTVAQLAKYTYTSREHLSRVFKEYTLESVHGYLTNLRMQHCRNAIAAGASVLDACNASGFTNYSSFLKSFRALYGVTPTEYRAQLRQSLAPN